MQISVVEITCHLDRQSHKNLCIKHVSKHSQKSVEFLVLIIVSFNLKYSVSKIAKGYNQGPEPIAVIESMLQHSIKLEALPSMGCLCVAERLRFGRLLLRFRPS